VGGQHARELALVLVDGGIAHARFQTAHLGFEAVDVGVGAQGRFPYRRRPAFFDGDEARFLRQVADARFVLDEVAAIGLQFPRDQPQQRGLPRAVRSDQADLLPGLNFP